MTDIVQVDDVKLGAKVVLRPKKEIVEETLPPELLMEDDEPVLSQGNAWVCIDLGYMT